MKRWLKLAVAVCLLVSTSVCMPARAYASGLESGIAFGMFRAYYHAFGTGSSGDSYEYQSIDVSNFPAITTVTNVFSGNNNLADYAQILIEGDFQDGVTYNIRFEGLKCTYGYGEGMINGSMNLTNFYVQSNNGNVDLMDDVSGNASGYQCSTTYTWDGSSDQRIILFFNRTGTSPNYDTYVQWQWSSFIMSVNVNSQTGANVSGILNIISQIWSTISNLPTYISNIITKIGEIPTMISTKFAELQQWITDLPARIKEQIVQGLRDLFIPDSTRVTTLVNNFKDDFDGNLGFLTLFPEYVVKLKDTIQAGINDSYTGIHIPTLGWNTTTNRLILEVDPNESSEVAIIQEQDVMELNRPEWAGILEAIKFVTSVIMCMAVVRLGYKKLREVTES